MRFPRITTRRLMGLVLWSAVAAAIFFQGMLALAPLVFAAIAYRIVPRPSGRRASATIVLVVLVGVVLVPLLIASLISRAMWGYYFARPELDHRLAKARRVVSVTQIETRSDGKGRIGFVPSSRFTIAQEIASGRSDPYYCLVERALIALQDRGRLPATPKPMSAPDLVSLYGLLEKTGQLEAGAPGYPNAKKLLGVVIEAEGADGGPLLFFGVRGHEVSNDHYPYYEFLFAGTPAAGKNPLLSSQRFYFDVAGIEGLEWPVLFFSFSIGGFLLTVPAAVLLSLVLRARDLSDVTVERIERELKDIVSRLNIEPGVTVVSREKMQGSGG